VTRSRNPKLRLLTRRRMLRSASHGAIESSGEAASNGTAGAAHLQQPSAAARPAQEASVTAASDPATEAQPAATEQRPVVREAHTDGLPPAETALATRDHTEDGLVSVPLQTPSASSELQHGPADDVAPEPGDKGDEQPHAAAAGAGSPLASLAGADVMLDHSDGPHSSSSLHDQPDSERLGASPPEDTNSQPNDALAVPSAAGQSGQQHAAANGTLEEQESRVVQTPGDAASNAAALDDSLPDALTAALAEAAASRRERDAAQSEVRPDLAREPWRYMRCPASAEQLVPIFVMSTPRSLAMY